MLGVICSGKQLRRQNILVSATLNAKVKTLAKLSMQHPTTIAVDSKHDNVRKAMDEYAILFTCVAQGCGGFLYLSCFCLVEAYHIIPRRLRVTFYPGSRRRRLLNRSRAVRCSPGRCSTTRPYGCHKRTCACLPSCALVCWTAWRGGDNLTARMQRRMNGSGSFAAVTLIGALRKECLGKDGEATDKAILFMSTCDTVDFYYEVCRLRKAPPGC
jgi:hypothetical protein